jgi:manganese oxidase
MARAMQEMMGWLGLFVAHPEKPHVPQVHHDFGLILQKWAVLPNNTVPNSAAMEFNWLTFNGVSAPAITPMIVRQGSRVRLRIVYLGMDLHPIHLHEHQFVITGTEGGRAPETTWYPTNTVLVGVAQAKVLEFEAKYPGAWMVHCHLPHHMMNSMMDLLRDRQIETADQTDERAVRQREMLAKSVPFERLHSSPTAENANSAPGSPQDAVMEMSLDDAVAKAETFGLPKNWSAVMMGMMTVKRVLPDREYEALQERITDGLEAPARPGEVDRPVRETNVPVPERPMSPKRITLVNQKHPADAATGNRQAPKSVRTPESRPHRGECETLVPR